MTTYYFIGIKGTGMAALACMLDDLGYTVEGSDLEKHFFTEDELVRRHITIRPFQKENIRDNLTVIIGNAFLDDFPEVVAARSNPTCKCYRYHEFVGEFAKQYKTISIAGSHGKTTTTGLVSSVFSQVKNTGWLIGDGTGHIQKDTEYFCLESDEFERHFLAYHPDYAIITNVDIDHVDYFKDDADYRSSYEAFSNQVKKALIIYGEDEEARKLQLNPNIPVYWYGTKTTDDFYVTDVKEDSTGMCFDVYYQDSFIGHFELPFVGHHLLLNSLAVIALAHLEGIQASDIENGLKQFKGVKRRFVVEEEGENIFIDDYAHHPTEVGVTIEAAKMLYPDKKLIAIFKPHRASRVMYFAEDFARELAKADEVYLCDFTSIDDKQDGTDIDITYLQERLPGSHILEENEIGAQELAKQVPAVFLFMSSKDIYWLAQMLKKRIHN